MTPTARSLKLLRDRGFLVEKVEQRLPIPDKYVTRDLWNFADLIAMNEQRVALIQVTTLAHMNEREEKIRTQCREAFAMWVLHGEVWIHGWRPPSTARGKLFKGLASLEWTVSERIITPQIPGDSA